MLASPRRPEPKSIMLLGSGTEVVVLVDVLQEKFLSKPQIPVTVKDSEGIDPTEF
jgi:hypothetical protein